MTFEHSEEDWAGMSLEEIAEKLSTEVGMGYQFPHVAVVMLCRRVAELQAELNWLKPDVTRAVDGVITLTHRVTALDPAGISQLPDGCAPAAYLVMTENGNFAIITGPISSEDLETTVETGGLIFRFAGGDLECWWEGCWAQITEYSAISDFWSADLGALTPVKSPECSGDPTDCGKGCRCCEDDEL